jgi:hypothetical protein
MDKKEKPNKTKKPKVTNPTQQTASQNPEQNQVNLPNISIDLSSFKQEY